MVLISRWASWKRLKPLDFQLAVAIRDTTPDRKLREAYHDAIGMYEWNRLNYWKDKLCAMKISNDTAPVQNKNGKRKREATSNTESGPKFEWPPGFGPEHAHDSVDDDEAELFLPLGENKRRAIKKEVLDTSILIESNALYEDSDADDLFSARKTSKSNFLGRSPFPPGMGATTSTLRRHKSSSMAPGKPRAENTCIE